MLIIVYEEKENAFKKKLKAKMLINLNFVVKKDEKTIHSLTVKLQCNTCTIMVDICHYFCDSHSVLQHISLNSYCIP